jgi:hypothetical protein
MGDLPLDKYCDAIKGCMGWYTNEKRASQLGNGVSARHTANTDSNAPKLAASLLRSEAAAGDQRDSNVDVNALLQKLNSAGGGSTITKRVV